MTRQPATARKCWCGASHDHPMNTDRDPRFRHAGPGFPCNHPEGARRIAVRQHSETYEVCSRCETAIEAEAAAPQPAEAVGEYPTPVTNQREVAGWMRREREAYELGKTEMRDSLIRVRQLIAPHSGYSSAQAGRKWHDVDEALEVIAAALANQPARLAAAMQEEGA